MEVNIDKVEHEAEDWRSYWDDISGELLDTGLAREARAASGKWGRPPVGTRRGDVNKGDTKNPKVRSRPVARVVEVSKQP